MHIADPKLGIFGANGIVAAGLPIAVGAATAAQLRADGSVAVAFFGDGAAAEGAFHEALNLAAVWHLPAIFFCENNGYAEFSPASTQHAASLEQRAAGYGIDYVAVDGNDVAATAAVMGEVVSAARSGRGPAVVEASTYRWHGHYEGDPQRYRSADELHAWEARTAPSSRGPASATPVSERTSSRPLSRPWPTSSTTRSKPPVGSPSPWRLRWATSWCGRDRRRWEPPPPAATWPAFRTMDAIRSALEIELATDDRVLVAGIDVGAGGNVFGLTRGSPISSGPRARHTDLGDGDRRTRRRGGDGRDASGGRADVPRLPRRLLRPAAQPGGQAAVHDRRSRGDGADRTNPVRCRAFLGKPALAEPRGAAGAHPRA